MREGIPPSVPTIVGLLVITMALLPNLALASTAALVGSTYSYNFNITGSVAETSGPDLSSSPYWWVNSGAKLVLEGGRGYTLRGDLPVTDFWGKLYSANNPLDTDSGLHPQNIFRLLTRSKWQDATQEVYFMIENDNLSASPNRNASNGLLLFNRYQDSNNLYYTGVRVDGSVIIKKKLNGKYYTMAEVKNFYPGIYNRDTNPNLLPKNKWIGLRSEVKNLPSGEVSIKVLIDNNWNNIWKLAAEATDDGSKYGPVISAAGFGGIRTDFMDVKFDNFKFNKI